MCIDTFEIECVDITNEDSEEKYIEKEFDYDKIGSSTPLNLLLVLNTKTSKVNFYSYSLGVLQSHTNLSTPPPEATV